MATKLPTNSAPTKRATVERATTIKSSKQVKSRVSKSVPSRKTSLREGALAPDAPFPIVAIGASAGGLEAYTEFFHALPDDTGMAFVVVQHLDPSHDSMLAEILAKTTRMRVEEVKPRVKIKPNQVYVIPSGVFIAITGGALMLTPRSKGPAQHLAINFFMHSLADERKSGAIGIVLSGTGTDGTSGMEDIKAEGGLTFAQEPASAKYDGMPRSAIGSGCVDFILRPRDIAMELTRIQHHPYVRRQEEVKGERGKHPSISDIAPQLRARDFNSILDQVRKASGVDFTQYKPNTIHRRALRRMVILKQDSLGEYAKYLKGHPQEAGKLFEDVLIPVTSFFRDFEVFEALKTHVYPAIAKDRSNNGTIRMWTPGCSTGEETYSLAITLLEFLGDESHSFQVQIFGTDLNEKGIQRARAGIYRESIAEEISPERLARFFVKVEQGYRVNKAVRDMCVFARQNLASDPPFSQMNLVSCRNLLIYIQPVLQKKIVPILHYALKPSGFLVLGGSESASAFPELFSVLDKKHKIFSKKSIASRVHYDFVQSYYPAHHAAGRVDVLGKGLKSTAPARDELDIQAEADRVVLKQHAPVGVVVNSAMEVIQFRGRTTPYLEPAPGRASLNVLKLARDGLALELRTLISAAAKSGARANQYGVKFDGNGHPRILDLSVTPLGEEETKQKGVRTKGLPDNRYYLILFDDVTPQWVPESKDVSPRKGKKAEPGQLAQREAKQLKQEAASAREALRSAIESEDALKEEFQSANEEILSANEELQSTNEELETSKEELQSANEELNTLNAELREKNNELHDLNNDISNLLNSTRIPVVMLDRGLRIRRLTPTADRLLKLLPSDVGRSLADIRANIEAPKLEEWATGVLESLQPLEREVRDLQGHWHSLHIQPYRTEENKIDGVVIALQDIETIKIANEQLRKSAEFLNGIVDTVREPLLVLNHELRVVAANKPFLATFQVSAEHTIGNFIYDLGNGQWNIPGLRTVLERLLPEQRAVTDFEVEHQFEGIGHRIMLLNARRLAQPDELDPMILLATDDVTERRAAERDVARLAAIVESSDDAIIRKDLNGTIETWNPGAERLFGYTSQEAIGQSISLLLIPPDRIEEEPAILERVRRGDHVEHYESVRRCKDGTLRDVSLSISPIVNASGQIVGASKIARDITGRKQTEQQLRASEERFRMVADNMSQLAWTCDQLGNVTWYNKRWLDYTGMTLTDMMGWSWSKVQHPDHLERVVQGVNRSRETGEIWEDIFPLRGKDGRYRWFLSRAVPIKDANGEVMRWFGTNTDITERKLAEVALVKSEKLAAAGRLAATLAHEINNPLQAVTNLITILRQSPTMDDQNRDFANVAAEELERVAHLTRQSLRFYRDVTSPSPVNMEETLDSTLKLYDKQIKAQEITIAKQYQSQGAEIQSYPGEIRQVFSTLLVNAIEAVHKGGHFTLRIRKSRDWAKSPENRGLRITLADDGCGIPSRYWEHLFEPFFTTKGDKGTGLGLWVAHGIVIRLGGSISVRSRVQPANPGGTCFSIFLPNQTPK